MLRIDLLQLLLLLQSQCCGVKILLISSSISRLLGVAPIRMLEMRKERLDYVFALQIRVIVVENSNLEWHKELFD